MEISADLISGAVNPIYGCMDMKYEALAYGCSSQIFFYDFTEQRVRFSLKYHTKRVNTVNFLINSGPYLLISSCADG